MLRMPGGILRVVVLLALVTAGCVAQPVAPLTTTEKLSFHAGEIVNPGAFLRSAASAGIQQWRDQPPEWEQGGVGYGRRYAWAYGFNAVRNMVAFGLDTTFKQDPRYRPSKRSPFKQRLWDSLEQVVVAHADSGTRQFAVYRVGSAYGTALISNAWRPDQSNNVHNGLLRGTITLGFDAASNVFREFWPDIRRRLKRK